MHSQNLLQNVTHDVDFLRLLSMVWIDAKDWSLADFVRLSSSGFAGSFSPDSLQSSKSVRAFEILRKKHWWISYQQKLRSAQEQGLRWICVLDDEYPSGFVDLEAASGSAPLGFWCWGSLPANRSISVVGSRDPVSGVVLWMKAELEPLQKDPWVLVSGGARGVDSWAHEICLNRNSPTVVVLPSGILQPYPSDWSRLGRRVLDTGGGLISEYDCNLPIRKHHFHARNRLIAALSPVTLILQAARNSGTWMTANWSVGLSRAVGVLPGPGWDRRFAGTHDLIRGGNAVVTERLDVESLLPTDVQGG